ncbi:MAG: SulP family inorganic anion transporter, partial [Acidimicrobiia bacterium]|nr:SulP family inorganic anion transporter [Acidimicrobiia bacterium]
PVGFPPLSAALPWGSMADLVVPAIVIALVGFAEPSAIARTYANLDRQAWDPDRELVSQGVANLAAGFSSAFPVGGSFSRSSVARLSGARTRAAGAVAGITVLLFLPFAHIIEPLPSAVLGAIVIAGVYKLIRIPEIFSIWRYSRLQAMVAITTFVLTLALAPRIDLAVMVGIVMGISVHLWRELHLDVESWTVGTVVHLMPRGVLYFGSAPGLGTHLNEELAAHPDARAVTIELQGLGRIDYTGALALKQAVAEAEEANLTVRLANVPDHARRVLSKVWEGSLPELTVNVVRLDETT